MRNWSRRVENQVRTLLRSHGVLFFSAGSASGLIFLIAIFIISPIAGASAVTGALVASFVARLAGADGKLVEDGLFGYNGVLAGLGSLSFVTSQGLVSGAAADAGWTLVLTLVSAATAGLLMQVWILTRIGERFGLPALTFPSIVGVWVWGKIFMVFGLVELSADALFPSFVERGWYGLEGIVAAFGSWADRGLPHLPVAIFMLLGYAMEQPRRIPAVVASVLASLAVGGLFLGPWASEYPGFTFFTATPLALALGLLFLVPGPRSIVTAAMALLVAAPVWEQLGLTCERLELPLLTLPFSLIALLVLASINLAPAGLRARLPATVPLYRVGADPGGPGALGAEASSRYWRQLDAMVAMPAEGRVEATLELAVDQLVAASRVVVLDGAGVSTESGVPDHRSGVLGWRAHDLSSLGYEAFLHDEEARRRYWRLSREFLTLLRAARPGRAHEALVELVRLGKLDAVVTQNVDGLHQRAGLEPGRLIELLGNEFDVACVACGAQVSREEIERLLDDGRESPRCADCDGLLKPSSTAWGEAPPSEATRRAGALIDRCNLLIVVGTTLTLEPAASLAARARARGARLMILNYGPTELDAAADLIVRGSVPTLLEGLVSEYKRRAGTGIDAV